MSTDKSQNAAPVHPRCSAALPYSSPCRNQFEEWISSEPYVENIERFPDDATRFAWPGDYRSLKVQLAWEAWAEGWERARM